MEGLNIFGYINFIDCVINSVRIQAVFFITKKPPNNNKINLCWHGTNTDKLHIISPLVNRLGKCYQKYFVKTLRKGDINENLNLEELSSCLTMDAFNLINIQSVSLNAGGVFPLLFRLHFLYTCKGDCKASICHLFSFIQRQIDWYFLLVLICFGFFVLFWIWIWIFFFLKQNILTAKLSGPVDFWGFWCVCVMMNISATLFTIYYVTLIHNILILYR